MILPDSPQTASLRNLSARCLKRWFLTRYSHGILPYLLPREKGPYVQEKYKFCCPAPKDHEISTSLLSPHFTTLFHKARYGVKWYLEGAKLRSGGKIQRLQVIYFPGLQLRLQLIILKPGLHSNSPAPPLTSCVALSKFLNISVPWFFIHKMTLFICMSLCYGEVISCV